MRTITTTLTWTRYDGTPETLPGAWRDVLLIRDGRVIPSVYWINAGQAWDNYDNAECHYTPQIGDTWAYWPEAPEVLE